MKGDAIMEKYTTEELKAAWRGLLDTEATLIWNDVEAELALRLTDYQWSEFVAQATSGKFRNR
jgi:hypothetical protein